MSNAYMESKIEQNVEEQQSFMDGKVTKTVKIRENDLKKKRNIFTNANPLNASSAHKIHEPCYFELDQEILRNGVLKKQFKYKRSKSEDNDLKMKAREKK
jgi:hypothetical protein